MDYGHNSDPRLSDFLSQSLRTRLPHKINPLILPSCFSTSGTCFFVSIARFFSCHHLQAIHTANTAIVVGIVLQQAAPTTLY